jgi:hypothetical protein
MTEWRERTLGVSSEVGTQVLGLPVNFVELSCLLTSIGRALVTHVLLLWCWDGLTSGILEVVKLWHQHCLLTAEFPHFYPHVESVPSFLCLLSSLSTPMPTIFWQFELYVLYFCFKKAFSTSFQAFCFVTFSFILVSTCYSVMPHLYCSCLFCFGFTRLALIPWLPSPKY